MYHSMPVTRNRTCFKPFNFIFLSFSHSAVYFLISVSHVVDKGNRVVVLDRIIYDQQMYALSSNRNKFKKWPEDPTKLCKGQWWWWWWWWIVFVIWLTDERHLALFMAGTIVRGPLHHESLTCHKQGLNLCIIWVQA